MQRIPTLDGWRGVAILLVIATHAQAALLGHLWRYKSWADQGKHGVTIFFVLSGFLITSRILVESPTFRFTDFYRRRFFRLAPVASLYLGLILVGSVVVGVPLRHELLACVFCFRNYVPGNVLTDHFWSLSIEEQFYLFWPITLVLAGRRWSLWIAALTACAVALFRIQHWQHYLVHSASTEVRMDALLIGCALALLIEKPAARDWFLRNNRLLTLLAASVLLFDQWRFRVLMPLHESIAIAVLFGCTCLGPRNLLARVLELRPLKWIGALSYSLYIWQELFLFPRWRALTPLMVCLMFVAAYASYRFIERPCIDFAKRRHRATASLGSRLRAELGGIDA